MTFWKAFFETNDYKAVVKESSVTAIRVAVGRLDRHVVWSDLKGLSAEVRQAIADDVERIGIGVDAVELAP